MCTGPYSLVIHCMFARISPTTDVFLSARCRCQRSREIITPVNKAFVLNNDTYIFELL